MALKLNKMAAVEGIVKIGVKEGLKIGDLMKKREKAKWMLTKVTKYLAHTKDF